MDTFFKVMGGAWMGIIMLATLDYFFPEGSSGYRQGQIDAINGKVMYELKTNPDKTVEWVKKEK